MKHSKHYTNTITKYESIMKAHRDMIQAAEAALTAEAGAKDKAEAAAEAATKEGNAAGYCDAITKAAESDVRIKFLSDRVNELKKAPVRPDEADALLQELEAERAYLDGEVRKQIRAELDKLHAVVEDFVSCYDLLREGRKQIRTNMRGEGNVFENYKAPNILADIQIIYKNALRADVMEGVPGAKGPAAFARELTDRQKTEYESELAKWNS